MAHVASQQVEPGALRDIGRGPPAVPSACMVETYRLFGIPGMGFSHSSSKNILFAAAFLGDNGQSPADLFPVINLAAHLEAAAVRVQGRHPGRGRHCCWRGRRDQDVGLGRYRLPVRRRR